MRRALWLAIVLLPAAALAAAKPHVMAFGKWLPVRLFVGANEKTSVELKVRPLYVDARLKEFTLGEPHDVTDRLLVVRRAFRVNDSLPADERKLPQWKWQRGGWLLVDRVTGRISQVSLPEFDPYYSVASWYRDYAAYCGVSDDGERLYAIVAQLGRRRAIVRKPLGAPKADDAPDSECAAPEWQRQPVRVTFAPANGQKITFSVRGHTADIADDDDEPPK